MKSIKKFHFTLLEVLTVLMILGIAAGAVGIQIRAIYLEQRFLSEVNQITNYLRTAQDLMLITDADMHFRLRRNNESGLLEYWLQSEKPLQGLFSIDEDKLKKHSLYGIQSVIFKPSTADDNDEIDLLFTFGKTDSGSLVLSPHPGDKFGAHDHEDDYEVVLYSYPHPIESRPYKDSSSETNHEIEESQKLYPEEESQP